MRGVLITVEGIEGCGNPAAARAVVAVDVERVVDDERADELAGEAHLSVGHIPVEGVGRRIVRADNRVDDRVGVFGMNLEALIGMIDRRALELRQ